ncbi:MAG: adenosylmethionine--8-amino-7-oxononanoate transaminase [Oligoflexus sp.]
MAQTITATHPFSQNHPSCFVTGTDTGVGKTFIAASLLRGLSDHKHDWTYWKAVQTGYPDSDQQTVEELLGNNVRINPCRYIFQQPASPNQAAAAENKSAPSLDQLQESFLNYFRTQEGKPPLLIEGAGGLLVPLNHEFATWSQVLQNWQCPALVVARSGLGTLNHTALTLGQLRSDGIPILGVVLNGPTHLENFHDLQAWFPDISFFSFPQMTEEFSSESEEWQKQCHKLAEWFQQQWLKTQQKADISKWLTADAKHCWHPYTQHKLAPQALPIVRAQGVWLYSAAGERYLDGISSWWTNTIGHGHPAIRAAISRQQAQLDHVLFAGVTHQAASELSEKLSQLTHNQLPRVFYSDNGSCAVEVALKIALQRWTNRGITGRRKILSFRGSYHGDTFGTMAVAAADGFHGAFRDLLFRPILATPATTHPTSYNPQAGANLQQRIQELGQIFEQHHQELACAIIEPMVQGSSGMNIQDENWLGELDRLCQHYEIPLVLDEVFTGMGRFGAPFVYQRLGLSPAMVCTAKGLTGGNLPLAATLVDEALFQDFYDEDRGKALYHGHTYTANPIACSAALATLEVYAKQNSVKRSLSLEQKFQSWLQNNQQSLGLENARCYGSMMAWELAGSGTGDYFKRSSQEIVAKALQFGILLRPLGNTLYFLPPLTISDDELAFALKALEGLMHALSPQ